MLSTRGNKEETKARRGNVKRVDTSGIQKPRGGAAPSKRLRRIVTKCPPGCFHSVTSTCKKPSLSQALIPAFRGITKVVCDLKLNQCFCKQNPDIVLSCDRCTQAFICKEVDLEAVEPTRELCTLHHLTLHAPHLRLPFQYYSGHIVMQSWTPLDFVQWTSVAQIDQCFFSLILSLVNLHAVHVVHRDIKPGNIVQTSKGYMFIDWGSSRLRTLAPVFTEMYALDSVKDRDIPLHRTTGPCTYPYSPPEVLGAVVDDSDKSSCPHDETKMDVFSLGMAWAVILFKTHMLTYKPSVVKIPVEQTLEHLKALLWHPDSVNPGPITLIERSHYIQHYYLINQRPLLKAMLSWDEASRPEAAQLIPRPIKSLVWLPPIQSTGIVRSDKQRDALDYILNLLSGQDLNLQSWFFAAQVFDDKLSRFLVPEGDYKHLASACLLYASMIYDVTPVETSDFDRYCKKEALKVDRIAFFVAWVRQNPLFRATTLWDYLFTIKARYKSLCFATLQTMHCVLHGFAFNKTVSGDPKDKLTVSCCPKFDAVFKSFAPYVSIKKTKSMYVMSVI